MRRLAPLVTASATALALAGCNLVAQLQGGPVVGKLEKTPVVGGEADMTIYLDLVASQEWEDCHFNNGPCMPPERATRLGTASSVYTRGSNAGFGLGAEEGFFAGTTDAKRMVLFAGGARLGLETLRGTAYASAGGYARLSVGFTISKTYDPHAILLCRQLNYLTFSLQGTVDAMPAASSPSTLPAASLLVGIAGVNDSGAPSDQQVPGARCPR